MKGSSIGKLVVCLSVLCLLAAGVQAAPVITKGGVQNVFGNQFSAAEIARGSWFAVKGTGLGPANIVIAPGAPYPAELSATKVTFTPASGGSAVESRMYYTVDTQVAGLLPSSTPAGDYDVRVIYNGASSAPSRVKVVERNFGFATANSSGQGQAQATNASLNSGVSLVRMVAGSVPFNGYTWQYRPAYPGETLIAWGTGLGADSASDVNGGTSGDMKDAAQVKVVVGGVEINPAYAGRSSGSPGLDQINFTLPSNVPQGCIVSVQVRAGGKSSNLGTLAISASGASICSSPDFNTDQIRSLASGGTVTQGSFTLSKTLTAMSAGSLGSFEITSESAGGSFSKFSADNLSNSLSIAMSQIGSCYFMRMQGGLTDIQSGVVLKAADAGTPLTFNGPNASNKSLPRAADNSYNLDLYSSGIGGFGGSGSPTLSGGTYTLAGPGGSEVGSFSVTSPFPASFNWTNRTSTTTITRGQPLSVNWTGGGTESGALVSVVGMSGTQIGGTDQDPIYDVGMFVCTAPASAQNLTVPADATNALAPITGDISTGNIGMMIVAATNGPNTGKFAPSVSGGGTAPSQLNYHWAQTATVQVK